MIHPARPGWQWGDPSPRTAAPLPPSGRRPASRTLVYGRVYELFTDDPRDGEHPYAGQVRAPKTIAARQREHRSAAEVARFPWKARIVDGPRGRRLLETVYATGDDRHDQAILDQVEAFWIDRLRTTHNGARPVRPRHGEALPPRPRETWRPLRKPARRRQWRVGLFAAVTLPLMIAAWLAVTAMAMPWPWLPYAVAPVVGVPLGWRVTMRVLTAGRRLGAWR